MDSSYTRVVGLINQLKSHGETIADQRVVENIIRSIPPRFESFVVTLGENKDMTMFTIDELQASLINHEHRINRTQTSLEGAFAAQSSISRGRARGETTSKAEEEFLQEEDEAEVLQMSVAEEITRTQVSQVARGLINQKFNVITVRSLVIMHMNAEETI